MRTGRSYVATAVALGIISLTGCASDSVESAPVAGDWGDPEKHPELGGAFNSLTAMSGTCTWNATTGAYTITIDDTAQTVVLGVRTVDSQLLVNGKVCSGTAGATTKLVKTVDIKAATGDAAAQAVVLDFLSGTFAPGVTGKPGITVDLGATSVDTLAIRGSSKADAFVVGAPASGVTPIAFNADAFADIAVKDAVVDHLTFSLAGDKDSFSAQGGTGYAGAYTGAVTVFGGAAADTLTGGNGADTLYGGADSDVLVGGTGNDMLYGEDGDDTINSPALDGQDTMDCGAGSGDKVSYDGRSGGVNVTLSAPVLAGPDGILGGAGSADDITVAANDGDPTVTDGATPPVVIGEKDNVLTGCEQIIGGNGNDTLIGDSSANTLTGGAGNDTLQGMLGADILSGGAGTDLVDYSEKTAAIKVSMSGDLADDGETASPSGGEKDNVKSDIENAKGGQGADEIVGNDFNNEIWGQGGADKLTGGKGDDTFHEGVEVWGGPDGVVGGSNAADDVASGSDSMDGGDGFDTVDYSERTSAVSVTLDGSSHVAGNDGTATYVAADATATPPVVESWTSTELDNVWKTVEAVQGGAGGDEIVGDMVAPTGTAVGVDNDFEGNGGDDKISGGYGNDTLSGSAGNDRLYGGAGDDTVEGGVGTNKADCGDDSDIAYNVTEITAGATDCELIF